jgi:hypothetical protein
MQELYLDQVKTCTDRANLTKLRISAQKFEIEMEHRYNIPRTEHFCRWCKTAFGGKIAEDEPHSLSDCNLDGISRQKIHQKS